MTFIVLKFSSCKNELLTWINVNFIIHLDGKSKFDFAYSVHNDKSVDSSTDAEKS